MISLNNIKSIAYYEIKILFRTWLFKLFCIFEILLVFSLCIDHFISEPSSRWIYKAISANIPYTTLTTITLGQVVAILFLSPDFLKRDKKIDTTEVFFIHPFSNAEYIIGKVYGILKLFFLLTMVLLGITAVCNFITPDTPIDWKAYIFYFFIIWLPATTFTVGLSLLVHLIIKNQALSFVTLIIYLATSVFYLKDNFYYIFDFIGYNQPMMTSTMTGYHYMQDVITTHTLYLIIGISLIFFSISLYKRIPNYNYTKFIWLSLGCIFFTGSVIIASIYLYQKNTEYIEQEKYICLNNQYIKSPKVKTFKYDIKLEQLEKGIKAKAEITALKQDSSQTAVFCINPGLHITDVKINDKTISFEQEEQIIKTFFNDIKLNNDTLKFIFEYEGSIDENFCYLDIPYEMRREKMQFAGNINIERMYHFQTPDFLLLTPENYWYPKSGTGYSNTDASWQQSYFNRYNLQVKTLPGLTAVSQGNISEKDGIFSFSSEFPMQNITLAIGKYTHNSITVDSITYSLYYIKENNEQLEHYSLIKDTLAGLIREQLEDLERISKLTYPFTRFNIIEVPGQFSSFSRTWTQVQEMQQPEMVLFPEKGIFFDWFDIGLRKQKHIKWAKWDGKEISELEQEIYTFWDFTGNLKKQNTSQKYAVSKMNKSTSNRTYNPYYVYPQLYNFRYNIYSNKWPIASRMIELYLENRWDDNEDWQRENYGITNIERCNIELSKRPFDQILTDIENKELFNHFLLLKGYTLFANAALNVGLVNLRDSIFNILKRQSFDNVNFENLLDSIEKISNTSFDSIIENWNKPVNLPQYIIGAPKLTRYFCEDDSYYELEMYMSNTSDYDGIIRVEIPRGQMRTLQTFEEENNRVNHNDRMICLKAHQTKKIVSQWDNRPGWINAHTLISGNLPNTVNHIEGRFEKVYIKKETVEGDFIVENTVFETPDEIIVDNEDSLLFSVKSNTKGGYLSKFIDRQKDNISKYKGFKWWRPPVDWTPIIGYGYKGNSIRSAMTIKNGDGNSYATWKIPIPEKGHYDVFHYVFKNGEFRNRKQGEYYFKVKYDGEEEDAYIHLEGRNNDWEQLGTYYFDQDTIEIVLKNNASGLRSITADAIKLVKRNDY